MKILTALDRSEYAEIVLEHGLDEAARHPADAELHFVTILPPEDHDVDRASAHLAATVREGLHTFGLADRPFVLHVRHGRPALEVCVLVAELGIDLLVVGRFHVPSESDVIVGAVECPTLVVGIDGPELYPQCPRCRIVRAASEGECLFCDQHAGDRIPDLLGRLPTSTLLGGTFW